MKNVDSLGEFNRKLGKNHTTENPISSVLDIIGIQRWKALRVEFININGHKIRHNFDCLSVTAVKPLKTICPLFCIALCTAHYEKVPLANSMYC